MVTQDITRNDFPLSSSRLLRTLGAILTIFSLVMSLLILFAIPSACSFVGSLQLVMLSFMFIAGGVMFFIGQVISWKNGKTKSG